MEHLEVKSKISKKNFNEYCRTCLKECKHEGYDVKALPEPIFRLFKKYASYTSSEKQFYPNFLCPMCYKTLKNFVEFCTTATHTTTVLAQILKVENGEYIYETTMDVFQEFSSRSSSPVSLQKTINDNYEPSKQSKTVMDFEEILIKSDVETTACDDEYLSIINVKAHPKEGSIVMEENTLTELPKSGKKPFPKNHLYSCPYCDHGYHYSYHLSKHLTEAHSIDATSIACHHEKCKKTFQHHETAAQHYKFKHEQRLNVLKPRDTVCICEECGRTFQSFQKLTEHRYKHKPLEDRPFHCEQCGKYFVSKRTFKEHNLRHAGIKAYECPHCGLKQTSVRELRSHINNHTKEKQFPCPLCSRVFNRAANLNIHDRVVHKGIRQFQCRYCDQSFGKPDTLKYHEMRHTGEKPHKCNVCERSFIQPSALKAHAKIHENKKANK